MVLTIWKVGNEPHGLWKYSPKISTTENACPLIPKYCGLYKTYGDKRLATNLITGLLSFVNTLLKVKSPEKANDVRSLFDEQRRFKAGKIIPTYHLQVRKDPWSK
jgi:hypothetical protein